MGEAQSVASGRKYIPYLEGIRGYGFLSVFFVHYFSPSQLAQKGTHAYRFWLSLQPITFLAVPIFFILSGYLIGNILFETRNREGFFRVFYARRVVRVFPVYYLTLLAVAGFDAYRHFHLDSHFWSYFLFVQNLNPDYLHQYNPAVMLHYWSLAVEEQFYLLWPLVVWVFPERRKLIAVASFLILIIYGVRFASPYIFTASEQIRYFSPTRADAILMGVILALIKHKPIFERMKGWGKWLAVPGILATVVWAFRKGYAWPESFHGELVMIPWINFTALAVVLAVMEESSWPCRVCSQRWICWFGKRSYSLYIFHYLYIRWFTGTFMPHLANHVPHVFAHVVTNLLALALTIALATLSYHLIEKPTQKIKQAVKYGDVREDRSARARREEALV
jgi:peptidoglycan/LPS O-acetylase OafA/YrhL